MDKKYSNLPLRSGVGVVVLNQENKVFVAKRIDNPKDFWQMPQGGVDSGEDFLKAAYRELKEETSIKSVKLIKELDGMITYELPERLLGIIWKGKYRGQKQKWFLMTFTIQGLWVFMCLFPAIIVMSSNQNNFNSFIPQGICTYLPLVTLLTVDMSILISSAISFNISGWICLSSESKYSF